MGLQVRPRLVLRPNLRNSQTVHTAALPAVALLVLLCTLEGAEQKQQGQEYAEQESVKAQLEIAARFEAVGRISEARARVLHLQALHPSHAAPALALQRLDSLRCPLSISHARHPPRIDGSECQWFFQVSDSARQQCLDRSDTTCAMDVGGSAGVQPGAERRAAVHVMEVHQGSCDILLEYDRQREKMIESHGDKAEPAALVVYPGAFLGVTFSLEDPETLQEIADFEDVDVVAVEGCGKVSKSDARWHSLRVQLDPMTAPGQLTWAEGMDPFTVARLFVKFEEVDAAMLFPLYSMVVSRNNAARGRANNAAAPPWNIPRALEDEFTMGGAVRVTQHYVDESASEARDHYSFGFYRASRSEIDRLISLAKARQSNYYGDTDQYLYQALAEGDRPGGGWGLKGKRVVIVGSLEPWYEAICLAGTQFSCFSGAKVQILTPEEQRTLLPARRWSTISWSSSTRVSALSPLMSTQACKRNRYSRCGAFDIEL
jgi:hypothetical protein